MSTVEARAARRIPVNNRVNLMVHGRIILAAGAANISPGGVFVNAVSALPIGSPCDVAIFIPAGEGSETFTTTGRVVRTGVNGLAIQFSRMLGERTLDVLAESAGHARGASLLNAYLSYFRVSQDTVGYECERIFGIRRETFRTISTTTFLISIPTAILPVWFLNPYIPPVPNWTKILGCFVYAALWLLVLQPILDLLVIKALKARAAHRTHKARYL